MVVLPNWHTWFYHVKKCGVKGQFCVCRTASLSMSYHTKEQSDEGTMRLFAVIRCIQTPCWRSE